MPSKSKGTLSSERLKRTLIQLLIGLFLFASVQTPYLYADVQNWQGHISSGKTFYVWLDKATHSMGELKAGEVYSVVYSHYTSSFRVTGNSSKGEEWITSTTTNANLSNNEISLWGRIFTFDANGDVFDPQNSNSPAGLLDEIRPPVDLIRKIESGQTMGVMVRRGTGRYFAGKEIWEGKTQNIAYTNGKYYRYYQQGGKTHLAYMDSANPRLREVVVPWGTVLFIPGKDMPISEYKARAKFDTDGKFSGGFGYGQFFNVPVSTTSAKIETMIAQIEAGYTFLIRLSEAKQQYYWLGNLKLGEQYKGGYKDGGFDVTGNTLDGRLHQRAIYDNANLRDNEISIWGRIFVFDSRGYLFDKERNLLVGYMKLFPAKGQTKLKDLKEAIASGSTFYVLLDEPAADNSWMGGLKPGEKYTVVYSKTNKSYTVTGAKRGGSKDYTRSYSNANLEKYEISLWGRLFTFDGNGNVYDKKLNLLVGHVKTTP